MYSDPNVAHFEGSNLEGFRKALDLLGISYEMREKKVMVPDAASQSLRCREECGDADGPWPISWRPLQMLFFTAPTGKRMVAEEWLRDERCHITVQFVVMEREEWRKREWRKEYPCYPTPALTAQKPEENVI